VALSLPAPAGAAPRKAPAGFVGMVADGPLLQPLFPADGEYDRMVTSGVESLRAAFYWSDAQPYASATEVPADQRGRFVDAEGRPTDFSAIDAVVAASAAAGLDVLPVVLRTPAWAAANARQPASPPRTPAPASASISLSACRPRLTTTPALSSANWSATLTSTAMAESC
ncbi:MAG: hypothetical protein ABR591_16555, partial [Candidatus Velthaea sp.]